MCQTAVLRLAVALTWAWSAGHKHLYDITDYSDAMSLTDASILS